MADAAQDEDEKSGGFKNLFVTILWALIIAFLLRIFVFQPFTIPSESMVPNLIKGDYIIASKYSVGYGPHAADPLPIPVKNGRLFEREPNRGDVIVFKPEGDRQHFVKRLVGIPGDRVQMIAGILYINDEPSSLVATKLEGPKDRDGVGVIKMETLPGTHKHLILDKIQNYDWDNTDVYLVPDGYYFMIGDNRDNSGDSRMRIHTGVGLIPSENIIGKAEFVLLSAEDGFSIFKPWTWNKIRGDRFFKGIK